MLKRPIYKQSKYYVMKINDLQNLMKGQNIKQVDIMKACDLSKGTVSKIINGDIQTVKVESIIKVAEYLKIPVAYYFNDTSAASQVREQPTGYNELMSKYVERTDELNEKLKTENEQLRHKLSEMESEKKGSKCV